MGKRVVKLWDLLSSGRVAALLLLSAAFLLGGLAGCLLAKRVGGAGGEALSDYLQGYLSVAGAVGTARPSVLSVIWQVARWPLLAVALSLTPVGLVGTPLLFLARGFLLSFAISSCFRVLGVSGLFLAFALFGLSGLISVPVLFVLGIQSFLSAGAMTGRLLGEGGRLPLFDRACLLPCCICAAALCACGLLEYCGVPVIVETLAGVLSG
jgi:hypothetical protein